VSSAKKTFGTYVSGAPKRAKRRCPKKPWIVVNCNTKRKHVHICKRRFIACKNKASKNEMLIASREYKKQLNIFHNKYKRSFKKEIRRMQSKSPKDYWNYINSLCDKKNKNVTVDSNIFFNFFKDLQILMLMTNLILNFQTLLYPMTLIML